MNAPLIAQLEAAKNALEDAQIAYCGAVTEHAEAKRILENAEAYLVCEGIEGKNETQRAAKLKIELTAGYHSLHRAEDALTEARCALEVAKLEWDLVRYKVRMLEAERVLVAA